VAEMSYLTEELKVESLYLLKYFMKSEQDESGSKELGFILDKITKRSDYVKASKGQYIKTSALFLQKVKRDDKKNPRYGVTASKKIGNAVKRNKAKRRIRHAIKEVLPKYGKSGYDYVVIATIKTNKVSWNTVLNDLERAFREIK
tara:strand:+ start:1171 stop:1605 length:435 start_codon:yes stop_codon:yes gene_type:complete